MKNKDIGFIGLGIMGESMCENIIKAGYNVTAFDIDNEKIIKMEHIGANKANSISEVAENSSYIIIMVPNSEDVKQVINDILPLINSDKVIIDMSTISPNVSRDLAKQVVENGGAMIDAPVVKSKTAAVEGSLGIYVGGDEEILEEVLPLLECMGKNIIRMGDNGAGLVMKLCHNTLVAEIQNGVNEMILLAQKSGIDIDSFIKAISYGGGQNFYLDTKGMSIKSRNFSPKFPFKHMHKDLSLTHELCDYLNLDLSGLNKVLDVYDKGMENGLSNEDFSASYKIIEQITKKQNL